MSHMSEKLTLLGGVEGVVPRDVLYVEDERRVGQDDAVVVDLVHCVLEGQLRSRVPLVLRQDGSCRRKEEREVRVRRRWSPLGASEALSDIRYGVNVDTCIGHTNANQ